MKPTLILLSGKQGSGKTTLANKLLDLAARAALPCFRLRFAGALYEIHYAALPILKKHGLEPDDCTKAGGFLQVVGLEYGRKLKGDNVWVDIVRRQVEDIAKFYPDAFITIEDCRFKNEFTAFPEALRVRLHCPEELRKGRTTGWRDNVKHPSETDLDEYAMLGAFDLSLNTDSGPDWVAEQVYREAAAFAYTGRKIETVKALRLIRG